MWFKIASILMLVFSTASCLELKLDLDTDSVGFPQWVSGTIKVKNNESRTKSVSMEESQPEFFLSQDTAVKLFKVIDFGPSSPVSLEPGVSAMWCFMAEIPEKYAKSKRKGPHKISLTMRQFGVEAKSKPFILWLPGTFSDKDLDLVNMRNLVSQLDTNARLALEEATKRVAFSGMLQGNIDPRIVFWKYRIHYAAYMKDLRKMPICENCFRMPATQYWSNLLSDWCRMFYWETPRCVENEARLQSMLVSRLGKLVEGASKLEKNPVVRTETGKFVVKQWQMEMLGGGGFRK